MKDVARPDIQPAFAERNIPVALATDENYLSYLKVTINSAIASSPGSNLDIIVLCAGVPEDAIRTFVAGYAGVGNVSVRFVDISEELVASGLSDYRQTARLPLSSCYRLLLPRILPAYGKIVYIDVDVAVCRDLGELYETDVGDNWFAAAKDVVYTTKPEYVSWAGKWGFAEWDGYVNAGVLVMNLERFRREPVFDRLKEIVFEAAKWNCDQDALNFVCKGAIAPLDPRWNVQLGDYCISKQIALTGEEMWIAHYTSLAKPWKLPARRYSHLWWRYAAEPDVLHLWAEAWGAALVQPVEGVPKVSIIIPVYNSARYLPEALASVLMQKDIPEIEVICIDDGSTDDSAAILDFWEKRDSRLKVLRQVNAGPGVARNAGLDAAKGEYIFFLDADDRFAPGDALLCAYEQAKRDNLDIVLAASSTIDEYGQILKKDAWLNHDLVPQEPVFAPDALGASLFLCTPLWPWGKLYRLEFLEKNKLRFPALRRSEDFPMVGLALALSSRIGVFAQAVVEHRTGVSSSLESTKDETPLIFFEAEKLLRDSLRKRKLWSRFKSAVYSAFVNRLAYNLRAVQKYSSFRAIIGKYWQEHAKWISRKNVDMPKRYAASLQLVKSIAKDMDDDEQIALFVKLREEAVRNSPEIRKLRADNKRIVKWLEEGHAREEALKNKSAQQATWLKEGHAREDALKDKLAKQTTWLEDGRKREEALKGKLAQQATWLEEGHAREATLKDKLAQQATWLEEGHAREDALKDKLTQQATWLEEGHAREGALKDKLAQQATWLEEGHAREGALKDKLAQQATWLEDGRKREEALKGKLAQQATWLEEGHAREDALKDKLTQQATWLEEGHAREDTLKDKLAKQTAWLEDGRKREEALKGKLAQQATWLEEGHAREDTLKDKLAKQTAWLEDGRKREEALKDKLAQQATWLEDGRKREEALKGKLAQQATWLEEGHAREDTLKDKLAKQTAWLEDGRKREEALKDKLAQQATWLEDGRKREEALKNKLAQQATWLEEGHAREDALKDKLAQQAMWLEEGHSRENALKDKMAQQATWLEEGHAREDALKDKLAKQTTWLEDGRKREEVLKSKLAQYATWLEEAHAREGALKDKLAKHTTWLEDGRNREEVLKGKLAQHATWLKEGHAREDALKDKLAKQTTWLEDGRKREEALKGKLAQHATWLEEGHARENVLKAQVAKQAAGLKDGHTRENALKNKATKQAALLEAGRAREVALKAENVRIAKNYNELKSKYQKLQKVSEEKNAVLNEIQKYI